MVRIIERRGENCHCKDKQIQPENAISAKRNQLSTYLSHPSIIMSFCRNDKNGYNFFFYRINKAIVFIYSSTPVAGKVSF